MQNIYGVTKTELENLLLDSGLKPVHAERIFQHVYKGKARPESSIARWSRENLRFAPPKIASSLEAGDGTVKFLLELEDGMRIESVLIPFHKKYTVCLSTQVGCGMGCRFCYTARQGFARNLEAHEIVGQYVQVWMQLRKMRPGHVASPNIVFMGQGEPLHNFDNLKTAIEILCEPSGAHLGPRQITVSTVGYLPGLQRLGEMPPVNLAVSLHSPHQETRSQLIPVGRNWTLAELFSELDRRVLLKRQFITYEYLLIHELTDKEEDAQKLIKLLKDRPAIVNLIPFNPFPGSPYKRPSPERVDRFKAWLVSGGIRTLVRTTKGDEILAACGQLHWGDSETR